MLRKIVSWNLSLAGFALAILAGVIVLQTLVALMSISMRAFLGATLFVEG